MCVRLPDDVLAGAGLFGADLSALARHHALGGALRLVSAVCRLLRAHLDEPGLFRVSASHADTQGLRHAFVCLHKRRLAKMCEQRRSGNSWDASAPDPAADSLLQAAGPHAAASLMVALLLELPEPLLPYALYEPVLNASEAPQPGPTLASALALLPPAHVRIFRELLELLRGVIANHTTNRMTKENLGTVLAPALLRAPSASAADPALVFRDAKRLSAAVAALIDHYDAIAASLPSCDDVSTELLDELPPPTLTSAPYGTDVSGYASGCCS